MGSHTATHLDSPFHFITGGKTIDMIPPERFVLKAHVIETFNKEKILEEEILLDSFNPGDALLFKTENSRKKLLNKKEFIKNFVYLSENAAKKCVAMNIGLVGVDYLSVDTPGSANSPAHINLLSNNIVILEGINLNSIPAGIYNLICLPLKIKEGDGSPTRAILLS